MNFKSSRFRLNIAIALFITAFIGANSNASAQISPQWTLDTTINNVSCYHMITKCGNEDAVLLRFLNERSATTIISWDSRYVTNLSHPSVHPGGRQMTHLPLGESLASDCSGSRKAYYIVASDIDSACTQINQFSFANISVQ